MDVMPLPEFKFHEVKGYNRYCGPTALATLLGITTDEAAKRIRQNSPRRKMVKSCHVSEVLKVLRQAGWQVVKMPPYVRTTTTLRQAHKHYSLGMYLLTETTHFRVLKRTLSGWLYVCSKQKTPAGFFGNRTRISSLHFLVPPTPIAVQINFPEEGPAELEELFRV
jgi:hypothetical protein